MAYTAQFIPETRIEEAQDGMGFKIFDDSVWGAGDQALTTLVTLSIRHIDDDEVNIDYDDVELIIGANRDAFNEYLSSSGHLIEIADLTIDGMSAGETFPDGYYEITLTYTPDDANTKYYSNSQAFLAKYRAMKRTMPALFIEWPITAQVREINYDVYTLGLYLDAAEDAADLDKKTQFRKFIALIRQIVDHYGVNEPW